MQKTIKQLNFILFKQSQTEVFIMHKKFSMQLIIVCIAFAGMPAHAYKVKTFQPLQINPLSVPYSQYQAPAVNENYPKITQIEYALFKRSYEKESIYNRLTRLETRLFRRHFNELPLATRVDNIANNIDAGIMYNISAKELARLERKVLGRVYTGDDTESRITRLEKEMLGAMQGGNLNQRFETVKTASKHYNSYPEIVQSQTTMTPAQAYRAISPAVNPYYGYGQNWTSTGGGIGGFFRNAIGSLLSGGTYGMGTMTGYTPPIYDPYSAYSPGMGIRNEYRGNTRSYIDNRNYGNGSTVRILD